MSESIELEAAPGSRVSPQLAILTTLMDLCAVVAVLWSGVTVSGRTLLEGPAILTGVAILLLPLSVTLPSLGAVVLFGEPFLMAVAVGWGTGSCVAATALYGLAWVLLNVRSTRLWPLRFGLSGMICGSFLYSDALAFVGSVAVGQAAGTVAGIIAMAVVAFGWSAALAAAASTWSGGRGRWWQMFRRQLPLFVNSCIAATCAGLCGSNWDGHPTVLAITIPAIILMWVWTGWVKRRVERGASG